MVDTFVMELFSASERNTAIVAAIGRGVALRTVCAVYSIDALTVRHAVKAAGQPMPVDLPGPAAVIAQRESEMLRRALEGEDFSVIARAHDVSGEWVRLVVKRHTGLSAKDLRAARDAARQQFKVQRARDLASDDPDLPLDELTQRSGLSVREIEAVLGPAESARRRRERSVSVGPERDGVLNDLRRVASLPSGTPLSGPFYDKHRGSGLSSARVVQVFGTWAAACGEAGVQAPSAARSDYTQNWSRQDCLLWVREYLTSAQKVTYAGYESWARGQESAPSAGTVRLRCGKWITTVRDAYALAAGSAPTPVRDVVHGRDGDAELSSTRNSHTEGRSEEREPKQGGEESLNPPNASGQGHQSAVEVRLKVEKAAQDRLMDYYRSQGWLVTDTHSGSPYDAVATRDGETLFLEAKGTQSSGATVLVTRGEVEHAQAHPEQCVIGIWSGIAFDEGDAVRADSGEFRVLPFNPQSDELVVVGYEWRPR